MSLRFDHLITEVGLDLADVRLLRHQDTRWGKGRTPFSLWRDDSEEFARYQSTQKRDFRSYFSGSHWASFVGTSDGGTLFVGLYEIALAGPLPEGWIDPLTQVPPGGTTEAAQDYDLYETRLSPLLAEYIGRVSIDWNRGGERSWRQRADRRNKPILTIAESFREPDYPGHTQLISTLAALDNLPVSWQAVLASSKGVYLLTCPRTREQYVGIATGEQGFLGRWREYAMTGHGGNVGLKSREPSDYQISILEVMGSAATAEDLFKAETLWKRKLQSGEMGLNRN